MGASLVARSAVASRLRSTEAVRSIVEGNPAIGVREKPWRNTVVEWKETQVSWITRWSETKLGFRFANLAGPD